MKLFGALIVSTDEPKVDPLTFMSSSEEQRNKWLVESAAELARDLDYDEPPTTIFEVDDMTDDAFSDGFIIMSFEENQAD